MEKTIQENDTVALLRNLPGTPLLAGDTGVVVYAYDNAPGYEVEFSNPEGKPRFLVTTVEATDLLKLQPRGRLARTVA